MEKDWTIDTCILYRAADVEGNVIELMNIILRLRHYIALDHERHIENEYIRCIKRIESQKKPGAKFVKEWFQHCISKLSIKFSGTLSSKYKRKMMELKFDNDDWPFIAVCSQTQCKILVSEESDYNELVKEYLQNEFGIQVIPVIESLSNMK